MAINYEQVGWDTTKYFNPSNMNHMDDGIKAACDKADANEAAIADVNNKLGNTDISAIGDGTVTGGLNALNSNLDKLVIYARTVFLTAEDGRIQIQTDYKPDKTYFLCCPFPNGFTSGIAQIDTNGLIIADYIYAPNATEKFSGDLWVNLCGVFKIK